MAANRIAAGVVIAIAAALFAATFWFEEMPEGITRGFGAEAFPRLILGTIAALAVLLFIQNPQGEPLPRIPAMVYYSAGALLLFMAIVPLAGMLPAMFLLLLGMGWLWGERRPVVLGSSAAIMVIVIWAIFVRGFGVQLPRGLL